MEWITVIIMGITSWFGGTDMKDAAPLVTEVESAIEDTGAQIANDLPAPVADALPLTASEADTSEPESPAEQALENETVDAGAVMVNTNPNPTPEASPQNIQTMLVAGGCFWCVEADLEKTPGVISAVSGYAGGTTDNPTYDDYGSGGHREVVEVTYDANRLSFEDVLIVTLKTTDPTDDDGTFNDRGDKYSAAFYYETEAQRQIIENLIAEVDDFGPYEDPLAIDVEERPQFWEAEDFHQDYYKGTLTKLKYQFYRNASGRSAFIERHWGSNTAPSLPHY
jgi:methionine-S-sulfoxide reductase